MSDETANPGADPAVPAEDKPVTPKEISRRDAIQLLAGVPLAAALVFPNRELERAWRFVENARSRAVDGAAFAPRFFTSAEYRTAGVLADMIIPRDERSGSATDAGVLEFMDFTLMDRPNNQKWMREGLAWIDSESKNRFGKAFADATSAQREQILNDIAWPDKAPAALANGVSFFNRFRDMTASGFWSSRIGVQDLRYIGNTYHPNWDGCPPAALEKLGVNYAKFDTKALRLTPPPNNQS
jgi:gluconate 2-dehydrogenase subunit 3-like protein